MTSLKYFFYSDIMYKPLPDILSYAQRLLVQKIEQRKFTSFLRENNIDKKWIPNIYNAATGDFTPSYTQIFLLRTIIPPCYWFYSEQEAKPQPVHFHALYDITHDLSAQDNILVARKILLSYKQKRQFKSFLRQCTLSSSTCIAVVNMMNFYTDENGCRIWRQQPTFNAVSSLKHIIHPDYWYIMCEELDDPFPQI